MNVVHSPIAHSILTLQIVQSLAVTTNNINTSLVRFDSLPTSSETHEVSLHPQQDVDNRSILETCPYGEKPTLEQCKSSQGS